MKKTLIIAALLASLGSMQAQDTVDNARLDGYYYNYVIDWNEPFSYSPSPIIEAEHGEKASAFYTPKTDSLTVIGIAAAMINLVDLWGIPEPNPQFQDAWYMYYYNFTYDTAMELCQEKLKLYTSGISPSGAFTLNTVREVNVHSLYDTAAYYVNPSGHFFFPGYHPVFKVYEKYFDTPVVVDNDFYLGVTHSCTSPYMGYLHKSIPFNLLEFRYVFNGTEVPPIPVDHYLCYNDTNSWNPDITHTCCYYIYPILQPADTSGPGTTDTTGSEIIDTTGTSPSDTLSIETVSRFTYLFPNPASHEVTITASFGITAVEAYNAAGTLVFSSRDSGSFKRLSDHAASLDLSSWPRGSYLLRIHTPAGTTTKKLIVQ